MKAFFQLRGFLQEGEGQNYERNWKSFGKIRGTKTRGNSQIVGKMCKFLNTALYREEKNNLG